MSDDPTPAELITPDAVDPQHDAQHDAESDDVEQEAVTEPAKVMRIGSMVKQLLDEVRQAPLDDQGIQPLP